MKLASQFKQLDQLLTQLRPLWQVEAFKCRHLPWAELFPTLADKVWQIADQELESLDADRHSLYHTFLPALQRDLQANGADITVELLHPDALPLLTPAAKAQGTQLADDVAAHFSAHIKGRKWQQIQLFADTIPQSERTVLEWCAGKGHLGRLIAKQQNRHVTSVEWQAPLCESGQAFATKWQLSQEFVCQDAFAADSGQYFKAKQTAVALHACGDLHVRLLKQASEAGTQQIAISPCCYHLIQDKYYQPLSTFAKQSELTLSRHDLQLPLQQSVIASDKQRQQRLQQVAWRLGFDELQRYQTGVDAYLPVPTMKQSQLNQGFEAFCYWAAEQKQVKLTAPWQAQTFLDKGIARQRLTRRIDLVAHLFRQALERWLLLDRVCYLQEQGYRVELFNFCDFSVTPRNGLIWAEK
ncbi:methyltransferase [Shewanella waksmanii]|uniref:methyltransferase n=1 Tax=Shewanella waksmanii TaxID=213783 RepID=UPI003736CDAD